MYGEATARLSTHKYSFIILMVWQHQLRVSSNHEDFCACTYATFNSTLINDMSNNAEVIPDGFMGNGNYNIPFNLFLLYIVGKSYSEY